MKQPQAVARILEQAFNNIYEQQMQGIPILNSMLKVQALGFQMYEDRILGVLITPWMMNVILLPKDGEDWSQMRIGDKRMQQFPHNTYTFMVNEIDGVGICQSYSIYSPMNEFINQDHALSAARSFLETMMSRQELTAQEQVDEELLGRILRGEEPADIAMENLPQSTAAETAMADSQNISITVNPEKKISRRDLLRGNLSGHS